MANKKQIAQRKQELVAQLAGNRRSISRSREAIKQKLQPKQLFSQLIFGKPKTLFAGSAVAGLGAALFLRRPRKVKKAPQSISLLLLGWVLALLKPAAKAWIVARAKEAVSQPKGARASALPPQ
jgi:hypothetical protein